ncbi:MAG: N(2)-acetyl-L-2,4-diaminobutanoate deacetylase DoeB [Gammaproteobacteria bacterium]
MQQNPISASVDFEADGVRHGHLRLPHSDDRSAWGAVMTPLSVIKNGDGATALLTGGNHGDEYEGPTALLDFAARIELARVRGRIIIVPMMNHPACLAGTRTSPLDRMNMNRVFPGRADGGPTEKIADYFRRTLLPMAEYVLDIHSGGKTLQFIPFAAAYVCEDARQRKRCEAAMRAFAAPYQVRWFDTDASGMYDAAALDQGKVFVSTELGGGGATSVRTLEIARSGLANFLIHAGILQQAPVLRDGISLCMRGESGFIRSAHAGLLELLADPGARVSAGHPLAKIYDITRSGAPPVVYDAPLGGIVVGRHHPGLVRHGDMIAAVAEEE